MKRKIVAITLLMCMLCAGLIACANGDEEVTDTATQAQAPDTSVGEKEEPSLSGKTYDGAEFRTYMSGSGTAKLNDYGDENQNGYSRVASAIHKRNLAVEQLYDISIENLEEFGASNGNGPGYVRISEDFASEDSTFELFHIGTFDCAQLAMRGYLVDLNSMPYIDLECKWWDRNANEGLTIHDKMFYTTGDISVVDNIATHTILFNKNVAHEFKAPDFYDLVTNGEWTYDKFLENIKLVSKDVDGNDTMNEKDRYGLLCWNDVLQASLIGSGIRLATIDEDGEMQLTLYSDKTVSLMTALTDVFNNGKYVYNYTTRNMGSTQSYVTYDNERDAMFSEDRCLFYGMVLNAVPRYRDSETLDFGILPYPKYDQDQENYGSYVGASYSVMVCIESTIDDDDKEFIGTVTESLAYDGMKLVTPEYYEQTLKGRYLKDEESWDMLDIIFSQRLFDVGMYYKIPSSNPLTQQITAIISTRENGTFTSRYEATKDAALSEIDTLNDMFYKFS